MAAKRAVSRASSGDTQGSDGAQLNSRPSGGRQGGAQAPSVAPARAADGDQLLASLRRHTEGSGKRFDVREDRRPPAPIGGGACGSCGGHPCNATCKCWPIFNARAHFNCMQTSGLIWHLPGSPMKACAPHCGLPPEPASRSRLAGAAVQPRSPRHPQVVGPCTGARRLQRGKRCRQGRTAEARRPRATTGQRLQQHVRSMQKLPACLPPLDTCRCRQPMPLLQVCKAKLWAKVGRQFNPPSSMTNLRWEGSRGSMC